MSAQSHELSMWKRALIAIGAMLGASGLFVGLMMLMLSAVMDRAVSSPIQASEDPVAAEQTQPATPAKANKAGVPEGKVAGGGRS